MSWVSLCLSISFLPRQAQGTTVAPPDYLIHPHSSPPQPVICHTAAHVETQQWLPAALRIKLELPTFPTRPTSPASSTLLSPPHSAYYNHTCASSGPPTIQYIPMWGPLHLLFSALKTLPPSSHDWPLFIIQVSAHMSPLAERPSPKVLSKTLSTLYPKRLSSNHSSRKVLFDYLKLPYLLTCLFSFSPTENLTWNVHHISQYLKQSSLHIVTS